MSSNYISRDLFELGNQKRKAILSLCYQLPYKFGFTRFDEALKRRIVDMDHLNEFLCGPKSIYKKKLNYHTPEELSKVIYQFQHLLNTYI
jgi:hypothetical protein